MVETGTYGESPLELVFVYEPANRRLEWHLQSQDLVHRQHAGFLDAPPQLLALMHKYIAVLPMQSVERVAYGVNAIRHVNNLNDGYREISQYLPFDVDYGHSSDFLYQINRKRQSKVIPGIELNRLMRWSVVTMGRRVLRLNTSRFTDLKSTDATIVTPVDDCVALNLELDINTVPKVNSNIPVEQLGDLLKEFADLAREIFAEGDVP
ncbi:MAG TPA: hypothetical protein DDY91_03185 [Planctomycetaceae bacterium]|nr:hypothetical protein [Planctomycetaceae bacterium]